MQLKTYKYIIWDRDYEYVEHQYITTPVLDRGTMFAFDAVLEHDLMGKDPADLVDDGEMLGIQNRILTFEHTMNVEDFLKRKLKEHVLEQYDLSEEALADLDAEERAEIEEEMQLAIEASGPGFCGDSFFGSGQGSGPGWWALVDTGNDVEVTNEKIEEILAVTLSTTLGYTKLTALATPRQVFVVTNWDDGGQDGERNMIVAHFTPDNEVSDVKRTIDECLKRHVGNFGSPSTAYLCDDPKDKGTLAELVR